MKQISYNSVTQLVRAACDAQPEYNDHTRKALLTGIYELVDLWIDQLKEGGADPTRNRYVYRELELMKDMAESALKSGNLCQAFPEIQKCARKIQGLDPQRE